MLLQDNFAEEDLTLNSDPTSQQCEKKAFVYFINALNAMLPENICVIDENSEDVFYKFLKFSDNINRSAFSCNWPYIVQATRKFGFHYQSNQSIIYFYIRKNSNKSKPLTLIIVNQLGHHPEISVCELAEAAKKLNIPTIVKNVDLEKVPSWRRFGFEETIEPWSRYSFRDDNTFPEFVYDIRKFTNLEFSRRTKTIINSLEKKNKFDFVRYNDSFKDSGMQLLKNNAEYLENKGVDFKKEVILAHEFVFDESIKNKTIFAILEKEKLIGISYMTHVENTLFFNAIINENKPNLMRFLLWKSVTCYFHDLTKKNELRYLALQGSENEGQNKWKSFFHPVSTIHRTHITNALPDY